ncbi:MAG: hypothetical protein KGO53_13690 [Alphaproteobacteria bacterium]|nr:hypothetical protein [Alphaproteobacteria bacterium]
MAKASAACEAEADRIAPIEVEVPPELLAREMDISGSVRRHWVMRCAEIDQAYERDVHWRRENADERKATRLAALEKYEASLAGVRVVLARLEGEFEKACNAKCEVADEVMASPSTSPAFIELKLAVICEMIEPGELNWNEIALLKLLDQLRGHAAMPGERVKS